MTELNQIDFSKEDNAKLIQQSLKDTEILEDKPPPPPLPAKPTKNFTISNPPFDLKQVGLLSAVCAITLLPCFRNLVSSLFSKFGNVGEHAVALFYGALIPAIYFFALPMFKPWPALQV